jgi:pilus assembly protein CpaE
MPSTILVADDSKVIVHMISTHFTQMGFRVLSAGNGEDALKIIAREKPDLLISDLLMPGIDGYEVCRRVRADPATAKLPVILLTTRGGITDKIAGLQVGADDYITKPFDLRELTLRVQALLARVAPSGAASKARTIVFFSLKGGVGVTSIAVNVGVTLARMWLCKTALLDMAVNSAQAALMLNLTPKYTLSELVREKPEDAGHEALDHYFAAHESGLSLLAGLTSALQSQEVSPTLIGALLPPLKGEFDYILVDTQHAFSETTLSLFEQADLVALVLSTDLASIKATSDALTALQSVGYPEERVVLLLNNISAHTSLHQKDIEGAVGKRIITTIPFGAELYVQSINRGAPLVAAAPNSPAAIALENLSYQLSRPEMREKGGPSSSPVLQRVRKRFSG